MRTFWAVECKQGGPDWTSEFHLFHTKKLRDGYVQAYNRDEGNRRRTFWAEAWDAKRARSEFKSACRLWDRAYSLPPEIRRAKYGTP